MADEMDPVVVAAIESVRIMPLGPNDVIVFKFKQTVSNEIADHVRDYLQGHFPGRRVLLLDASVDVEIVRLGGASGLH